MPAGPLAPHSSAAAAWTGTAALIWRGHGSEGALGDGASFDLEQRTWTPLADSPLTPRVPVATVWTGREFIVWGDTPAGARDGAAYRPGKP
jgi:hypothetical protein